MNELLHDFPPNLNPATVREVLELLKSAPDTIPMIQKGFVRERNAFAMWATFEFAVALIWLFFTLQHIRAVEFGYAFFNFAVALFMLRAFQRNATRSYRANLLVFYIQRLALSLPAKS